MSPVWIIEGRRPESDPVAERNAAERRHAALSAAVREHERNIGADVRPQDLDLYDRLREISDER